MNHEKRIMCKISIIIKKSAFFHIYNNMVIVTIYSSMYNSYLKKLKIDFL